jgi:hypothetical protein
MTTIGGVAFRHLDRLPRPGDNVTIEGILITVLEMDEHRITKVRANRGALEEEDTDGNDPFQKIDGDNTTADRDISAARLETASKNESARFDAAESKIADDSGKAVVKERSEKWTSF